MGRAELFRKSSDSVSSLLWRPIGSISNVWWIEFGGWRSTALFIAFDHFISYILSLIHLTLNISFLHKPGYPSSANVRLLSKTSIVCYLFNISTEMLRPKKIGNWVKSKIKELSIPLKKKNNQFEALRHNNHISTIRINCTKPILQPSIVISANMTIFFNIGE